MNISDIRTKDDAELTTELLELRRETFNLRMQNGTGQLSRNSQFKVVRKDIARIKTVMTERKRANAAE
ncbi:MAG: large subunit ribosomal protein L29 [Gammaproteobacteria bacterium]